MATDLAVLPAKLIRGDAFFFWDVVGDGHGPRASPLDESVIDFKDVVMIIEASFL